MCRSGRARPVEGERRLACRTALEADLQRYAGDADIVLLPAPNALDVQPIDFSRADRLIADAAAAARARLSAAVTPLRRAA